MRKLPRPDVGRQLNNNKKISVITAIPILFLSTMFSGPLLAADDVVGPAVATAGNGSVQVDQNSNAAQARVTQLSQAGADAEEELLEEVIVTGTQIKGAAISEALSVSVISSGDIESLGISSGDELMDYMPENGQNFVNEAENISGGVNAARGDIGAFNLRNMGTGNTLALLNGRRLVQAAGFQTESIGGSFVPVVSVNTNAIPVFGVRRVEVLRDGASAIYGADAVAGVINTVLKNNFEGLTIRGRYDWYDNVPRTDQRINIEWGHDFNQGRTNVSLFFDFYHRDRVNSQDDDRWANSDMRYRLPDDSPWADRTSFRNTSIDSLFGQFDMSGRIDGITDSRGEFETFPVDDVNCQHEDAWYLNEVMCGLADGKGKQPDGRTGNYRYNLNENRDLSSELDRQNYFLFINHEFENGAEAYTEFSYYTAKTNLFRHPVSTTTGVEMRVGVNNYYNPFGPLGSPNRAEWLDDDVYPQGRELRMDYYRWAEKPRIVNTKNNTIRFLQGLRGSWGEWDYDGAIVYSRAERKDVTSNRVANGLMREALNDPTAAAYNPFNGGAGVYPSNLDRALVDVSRENTTDLKMIDFKVSKSDLFNLPAGPVGLLLGTEYRKESFKDVRDPRLNGTIPYTDYEGDTFPFISDVANSSPSADSSGLRSTTSFFAEFAVPVFSTVDVQLAVRYENASDFGSATVPKIAFGWRVFEPLLIRGSWSKAYRAPNLITINEDLVVRTNTIRNYSCQYAVDVWEAANDGDSSADDELVCSGGAQRRASGSKDLDPEKSTNTSIGAVWEPLEGLMLTLDFWSIEKKDTIGLFGETNHTLLDLLIKIEAGTGSCAGVGNPAVGHLTLDPEDIPYYLEAGICPSGQVEYVEDKYQNLDTRTVKGHDIGIYYSLDTSWGSWDFKTVGSFYDKYEQEAGGASLLLLEAQEAGILPESYPIRGFDDLLKKDGNQTTKYNASLRWRKDAWGAAITAFYLSRFEQTSLAFTSGDESYRYIVPSMSTFNASVDYRFDLWKSDTRLRFGVNNFTNERAPLADRYFGYFADAHRDLGRYFYLDLRLGF
jgi:iron complex outermembrane receptor protein